jgi:hypothetical protein
MPATDTTNHSFALAANFVNQTNLSVFLTGKAGTGKTTFLRYIKATTFKKAAIVAPTGVAAINAGGVTMHSFFGLPFGPYIPVLQGGWDSHAVNKHSLFKNLKLSSVKRTLIQELELLIIDEVSMVRADMLDAVDAILRHYRHQPNQAFGGVQVLFIGDLFQLPPVANPADWELLRPYYKSPFFFDAQVLADAPPLFIELKKIYRQNDADFIHVLNNVRNNCVAKADLDLLHQYYRPGYEPPADEHYITLTTHNAKADGTNQQQLQKLPGKLHSFNAEIKGDFSDKAYPAEPQLQLKEGAQIMFIKNDKGEARRYYNGKIATVSKIAEGKIAVQFPGEPDELFLEKETWKSIRYTYDKEKDNVDEEELGSFTQYPIRLAWAITIHKSQGLTFERAVVDAGASFAPGQVYVALSRLTSLSGLVLHSRINPATITSDERVLAFSASAMEETHLQQLLKKEQEQFVGQMLVKSFDWSKLTMALQDFQQGFEHRLIPDKHEAAEWAGALAQKLAAEQDVALKFNRQLEQLLPLARQDGYAQLHQRVAAAVGYFAKTAEEAVQSVQAHLATFKTKQRVKKYLTELRDILLLLERKKWHLQQSLAIAEGLQKGVDADLLLQQIEAERQQQPVSLPPVAAVAKPVKGDSQRTSLALFKEGKSIADIAKERGLAASTIEGHLAGFVATGEVPVEALVAPEKMAAIARAMDEHPGSTGSALKELLGDGFSYVEIKAVFNYRNRVAATAQPAAGTTAQ